MLDTVDRAIIESEPWPHISPPWLGMREEALHGLLKSAREILVHG